MSSGQHFSQQMWRCRSWKVLGAVGGVPQACPAQHGHGEHLLNDWLLPSTLHKSYNDLLL